MSSLNTKLSLLTNVHVTCDHLIRRLVQDVGFCHQKGYESLAYCSQSERVNIC